MDPNELLGRPVTSDYIPDTIASQFVETRRLPPFSSRWVPTMLRNQRIQFGLKVWKGPILAASRFYIKDDSSGESPEEYSDLKKFLVKNITRFWRFSAVKALRAVEWGYSGHEALYTIKNNQVCFDALKCIHPKDARVVTLHGEKIGMTVRGVPGVGKVYLGGPKSFWHIHNREDHIWFGQSQLFGAFEPWMDIFSEGGSRDIRRLYYHKYAFSGDIGYYPTGKQPGEPGNVNPQSRKDMMRTILEKRRTGASTYFPNVRDADGNRGWEIENGGSAGGGSADVREYHGDLKNEIFEGMGIPNEVVEAAEVGSGWSGRRVPQTAFFATLQDNVNWLMFDFDQQVLRPLVTMNLGIVDPDYEIIPFGLLTGSEEEEQMEMAQNNELRSRDRRRSSIEDVQRQSEAATRGAVEGLQFALVV